VWADSYAVAILLNHVRPDAKATTSGTICFLTSTISGEELVIDSGIIVEYCALDFLDAD